MCGDILGETTDHVFFGYTELAVEAVDSCWISHLLPNTQDQALPKSLTGINCSLMITLVA